MEKELFSIYAGVDVSCVVMVLLLILKAIRAKRKWRGNYGLTNNLAKYIIFGSLGVSLPWIIHLTVRWILWKV
jgi:hypothetical protein